MLRNHTPQILQQQFKLLLTARVTGKGSEIKLPGGTHGANGGSVIRFVLTHWKTGELKAVMSDCQRVNIGAIYE